MNNSRTVYPILAGSVLLVASLAVQGCTRAVGQAPAANGARNIELSVYKDDFGMVRETRPVDLESGRNVLRLKDVSKTLDPQSVIFDWGGKSGAPQIVSNTYDLGVSDAGSLLKRFQGQKVDMIWRSEDGKPGDTINGTLEVVDGGNNFVLQSDGKYYVNPPGTIVAPSQGDIVTMPQLSADVESPSKQTADLSVGYLTRGLSWSADYTAALSDKDDSLKLECWATVVNHTGVDYPMANLTLMAGSPNRAAVDRKGQISSFGMGGAAKADMGLSESRRDYEMLSAPAAVGELQAYKVPKAASIGQEQMNRVVMLSGESVPIKRDYSMRLPGMNGYEWYYYGNPNSPKRLSAQLSISFVNDEKGGLGMPLPAGAVRVYSPDKGNHLLYTGAASLGDTPKNAHVNLTLSNVFDVYGEAKTLTAKRIDKRHIRKTMEVVLHNEKGQAIDLRMVQNVEQGWKLVKESHKSIKLDGYTIQRTVNIPAGGTVTVTATADLPG